MENPSAPGWYDDPEDPEQLRYFDGIVWSRHTTPKRTRPSIAPEPAASAPSTQGHASAQAPAGPAGPGGGAGRPLPGTTIPGGTTDDGQPLASYAQRVGAWLLDWIITSVLATLVAGYFFWRWMEPYLGPVLEAAARGEDISRYEQMTPEQLDAILHWPSLAIAVALSVAVWLVYQVGFLAARNATPGKMLVGISVLRDGAPGRLGLRTALMRCALPAVTVLISAAPLISVLAMVLAPLDLLWPSWDQRQQALHDKVAGTQVVQGPSHQPPVTG